jgi:hypothetical protein
MLVSTDENAGELLAPGEDTRFYDDIRCLAAEWAARGGAAPAFVHLRNGAWSTVQAASFARPSAARTAMGSGVVAFATPEEARAADRMGQRLTWDEVVTLARDQP